MSGLPTVLYYIHGPLKVALCCSLGLLLWACVTIWWLTFNLQGYKLHPHILPMLTFSEFVTGHWFLHPQIPCTLLFFPINISKLSLGLWIWDLGRPPPLLAALQISLFLCRPGFCAWCTVHQTKPAFGVALWQTMLERKWYLTISLPSSEAWHYITRLPSTLLSTQSLLSRGV